MNIWLVKAGDKGQVEELALKSQCALIGWHKLGDLSNIRSETEIELLLKEKDPKEKGQMTKDKNQIDNFINAIEIGDLCILLRNQNKSIAIGFFVGEYQYFPDNPELGAHGRSVRWITKDVSLHDIPSQIYHQGMTVINITNIANQEWIHDKFIEHFHRKYAGVDFEEIVTLFRNLKLRKKIEAKFDEYDDKGEKAFLDKYGDKNNVNLEKARKFWVQSTKKFRKNQQNDNKNAYISKAIAMSIIGRSCGGGMTGNNTAGTVLHNSGYIVTKNEKPYVASEDEPHLSRGDQRIRTIIFNYYIEPEKDIGIKSVEINVKELHDKIGLVDQLDSVRNVLNNLIYFPGIFRIIKSKNIDNSENFTIMFDDFFSTTAKEFFSINDISKEGCFLELNRLKEIRDIWKSKKNMILQGPPGTGKTWLAKRLAYALVGHKNKENVLSLQFHPNLSYEDFIRGWRPSKEGKLEIKNGPFIEMVEVAKSDPTSNYAIVIEEINRGNPVQIFGEMLTLLEVDYRNQESALKLTYNDESDSKPVYVPDNLYIIGTMNLADRSLAIVDLALRRRFAFEDLEPTFNELWQDWGSKRGLENELLNKIKERITKLNKKIKKDRNLGKNFCIGHSFFTPKEVGEIKDGWDWYKKIIMSEIKPLLEDYWYDSTEEDVQEVVDNLLKRINNA